MLRGCKNGAKAAISMAEEVVAGERDAEPARGRGRIASEERRCRQEEEQQTEQSRRAQAEADALRRAEEEARGRAEALRHRVREAERAFEDERARYEQLRVERERAEGLEMAQQSQAGRTQVTAFLKAEGFGGVNQPKRSLLKATYPLHHAAERGSARMVELLLKEGADARLLNSSGQTAEQVAQQADVQGSHAAAIHAFQRPSTPRCGDKSSGRSSRTHDNGCESGRQPPDKFYESRGSTSRDKGQGTIMSVHGEPKTASAGGA